MSRIGVLVACEDVSLEANVIAESIRGCSDMSLVSQSVLRLEEVSHNLEKVPKCERIALVLVGRHDSDVLAYAKELVSLREEMVVLYVDIANEQVKIELNNPSLDLVLKTLRSLLNEDDDEDVRIAGIQIDNSEETDKFLEPVSEKINGNSPNLDSKSTTLFEIAQNWIHSKLLNALENASLEKIESHGFGTTHSELLALLKSSCPACSSKSSADEELRLAFLSCLERCDEPLGRLISAFELSFLEFRLFLLALAPYLDNRYRRSIGYLQDDMSSQAGTLNFYCSLLGPCSSVRQSVEKSGRLYFWRAFSGREVHPSTPLFLDPYLVRWILGSRDSLKQDPVVSQVTSSSSWPGWTLIQRASQEETLQNCEPKFGDSKCKWILLCEEPEFWLAKIELECRDSQKFPLRVIAKNLSSLDLNEIADCGLRVGRLARLTNRQLVILADDSHSVEPDRFQTFIRSLGDAETDGIIVCQESELIGYQFSRENIITSKRPVPESALRSTLFLNASERLGLNITKAELLRLSRLYPLKIDQLEHVVELVERDPHGGSLERFIEVCQSISTIKTSACSERLQSVFQLEDVVLPIDRINQLKEIVWHVHLAPKVLHEWNFAEKLPYGQGVVALFFGPSGVGKTMAAMAIASELGVQLLRVDLSRVVSKYIGETEKNIDQVFRDAQSSGAAILFDEADALLGKRSEVKDARDRYANIEVAYLLQRMEQFPGLVILTTNMRQNLDSAFLRRIRFVINFPSPDATSREKIWRFCLPDASHEISDQSFRHLSRKLELNGGNIRQLTLRAAFLAAADETRIGEVHISKAVEAEYQKLGLPRPNLFLNGWGQVT